MMIGKTGSELDSAKLDELCQERVLQKRRQIRLDIRSKQEEIERHAIFPFEEGVRPFGIEREGAAYDVWNLILERVNDPTEICKLREVSKMFLDILRRKYVEARLPEIVQFVLEIRPNYVLPDFSDEIFWKLRQVSRECQISTDQVLFSRRRYISSLELQSIEKIETICTYILENPSYAGSFFSQNIKITESEGDDFFNDVTTFLGLVGSQIRIFTYVSAMSSHRQIYRNLREWMDLMPNLERLSLNWTYYPNVFDVEEPVPNVEEIDPFPRCDHLKNFNEVEGTLPAPYVHRILEACPVVKNVKLEEGQHVREHSIEMLRNLENLTTLKICPYRALLPRQQLRMNWQLKTLILDRKDLSDFDHEYIRRTTVSSGKLFSFLRQFGDTLQQLEITIDITDCCDSCGYLELPNLRSLKWTYNETFENLDFLLYLERLEELQVTIDANFLQNLSPEERYNKIIGPESGSFLGKGIWNVFPHLRKARLSKPGYFQSTIFEKCRELL